MLHRLQNSAQAMSRFMRRQDHTANNLANANTIGYKQGRVFTDVLSEHIDHEGSPQSANRMQDWSDLSEGELEKTGNPLDVALAGDGLFTVRDENHNQFYTRAGRFSLDGDGVLRDMNGYAVQGQSGRIVIPPEAEGTVNITNDGVIKIEGQPIDRLQVLTFQNPRELTPREGSLLSSDQPPTGVLETPTVRQGFVEGSNVDPVHEMTNMIEQARMFETQQRWLRTTDQILGRVSRELGKF
jgi:flagellar basal-body rod protein FlgF/flagellar basal-body rod protein FlgG